MSEKVSSAEQAMLTMMLYYHMALQESGVTDTKQVILDSVLKQLESVPSVKYSLKSPNASISPSKIIDDIIILLDAMKTSGKLNVPDLVLIKQNISALKKCIVSNDK